MKLLLALAAAAVIEWVPTPYEPGVPMAAPAASAPAYTTQANCDAALLAGGKDGNFTCVRRNRISGSVAPPPPPPPPASSPLGVWTGVTASMWSEINAQRAAFGDTNDCQSRVGAIPSAGALVQPGGNIQAALSANPVVLLGSGVHPISSPIQVPAGRALVGLGLATIDARNSTRGVYLANGATLSNVIVDGAKEFGVLPFASGAYQSNTLVHQVSIRRTGWYGDGNAGGSVGLFISGGSSGNCVVSSEVFDSYGASSPGNSDGVSLSYGAHHNTLIDFHSYRNADDGIDMWEGGVAFVYFSKAWDNGKTTSRTPTGDGNGVKLGTGSVAHMLYKVDAKNNKTRGFNINGNTVPAVCKGCTASGNPGGNFVGVTATP